MDKMSQKQKSENFVKLKERKRDGVAIIELSGKLMGGPDAETIDETIKTLLHEGVKNIVVNLEKVRWVNSTGLGILISGYTTVKKSGGELKLLKVSDRIENIFIVSKLYTVFESELIQLFLKTLGSPFVQCDCFLERGTAMGADSGVTPRIRWHSESA